jgi:hypothetical protein
VVPLGESPALAAHVVVCRQNVVMWHYLQYKQIM